MSELETKKQMENSDQKHDHIEFVKWEDSDKRFDFSKWEHRHTRFGKILGGLVILAVGLTLLLRQMGWIILPEWVFTWEAGLILMGIYIGARHTFRHPGWLIPVAIGSIFLVDDIMPGTELMPYIWPILIISIGLAMILSPRKRHKNPWEKMGEKFAKMKTPPTSQDYMETVCVFGSVKKNIISKNFRGGEIVTCFGGSELNLSQADINGKVVLDMSQIFGGTKLVIPPHWEVHSEIVNVFGGLDDKRSLQNDFRTDPNKILVLKGSSIFGGIDIESF
jgi:hypothetical protein